jgi:hypothetical protein
MKSLADPTKLKPVDKKTGLVQVIIETPSGSRNKFAYDPEQAIFALKKVLPAGKERNSARLPLRSSGLSGLDCGMSRVSAAAKLPYVGPARAPAR